MSKWPGKNDYSLSPFYFHALLKLCFYKDLSHCLAQKAPVGLPRKTSKTAASQLHKTASKNPLDEIGYNLREFVRYTAENIANDFKSPHCTCHDS